MASAGLLMYRCVAEGGGRYVQLHGWGYGRCLFHASLSGACLAHGPRSWLRTRMLYEGVWMFRFRSSKLASEQPGSMRMCLALRGQPHGWLYGRGRFHASLSWACRALGFRRPVDVSRQLPEA